METMRLTVNLNAFMCVKESEVEGSFLRKVRTKKAEKCTTEAANNLPEFLKRYKLYERNPSKTVKPFVIDKKI